MPTNELFYAFTISTSGHVVELLEVEPWLWEAHEKEDDGKDTNPCDVDDCSEDDNDDDDDGGGMEDGL